MVAALHQQKELSSMVALAQSSVWILTDNPFIHITPDGTIMHISMVAHNQTVKFYLDRSADGRSKRGPTYNKKW